MSTQRHADMCTTHHHACDCREFAHAQEIEHLRAELAALRARIEAGVIVEVKQAGDDEFGQARVLAYSTRDELRKGPPLVFKRVALVPLDD